ncbi:hypothetical protein G7Y89_g13803 [Cudoniella acicularis]|uniref:Uncharacterized protein n=1 Tax=Cudoniella acicularis TaxID=354080 RepID=A0A8H4R941_9HELO|nr:hypothetical protein G7Y89_g13803 [Cudoniella acicularis]
MSKEVNKLRKFTMVADNEGDSKDHEKSSRMVDELIACHINTCQNLALRAEYEEKRTQTQLAVVYQYMTQKEAIVNSKIAYTSATITTKSKKDGSAMKAIAVLTMFFLPGTFLATIFAMLLFNWDTGSHPIIKDSFKYYWAIAVPMTILVLLLWGLSVWLPWKEWLSAYLPKKPSPTRGEVSIKERQYSEAIP